MNASIGGRVLTSVLPVGIVCGDVVVGACGP
jgi:hypothetical protein